MIHLLPGLHDADNAGIDLSLSLLVDLLSSLRRLRIDLTVFARDNHQFEAIKFRLEGLVEGEFVALFNLLCLDVGLEKDLVFAAREGHQIPLQVVRSDVCVILNRLV